MFITGPQVIKQVTGEQITADELGGADAHMALLRRDPLRRRGRRAGDPDLPSSCSASCRSNNSEDPPRRRPRLRRRARPRAGRRSSRRRTSRATTCARSSCALVDHGDFLEVQAGYAANIVVGFGRITGRTVGIVANQPLGPLRRARHQRLRQGRRRSSASATPSTSRWSRWSTCPASCPASQQEHGGIIRHGAKLLFAYSAATVPKITVILRKAYGGAYVAMCSKDLGADRVLAWPTAEIAVMGAEGAAEIVFRKEIADGRGPGGAPRGADRGVPLDLLHAVRRGGARPGRRHHRAGPTPASTCRGPWRLQITKRTIRPAKKHGLGPT